jgi:hypothetical protein
MIMFMNLLEYSLMVNLNYFLHKGHFQNLPEYDRLVNLPFTLPSRADSIE